MRVLIRGDHHDLTEEGLSHLKASLRGGRLIDRATMREVTYKSRSIVSALIVHPLLGGKGGFGANLKREGKNANPTSRTYYRDHRTGATVQDIERLRRARALLEKDELQQRELVERRREKLRKAIEYYEGLTSGQSTRADVDLEGVDEVMDELHERLAGSASDADADTDDLASELASDLASDLASEGPAPEFASFYD